MTHTFFLPKLRYVHYEHNKMKYPEYEHFPKLSIAEFRPNMAEAIELMEETGKPLILTRRGIPVVEMKPVSLRAYRSMLREFTNEFLKAKAEGDEATMGQLQLPIITIQGKIAQLTNNSKILHQAQADIRKILIDSMPEYQTALFSSEDSAMLESNTSVGETGADKQTERSVVRSAKSEKKKSPAKAKNSRPQGGTAAKGRVKR